MTVEDYVLDDERFAALVKELLPAKQQSNYEKVRDNGGFIVLENSLHEEDGQGFSYLRVQCHRGVLGLMVSRPLRTRRCLRHFCVCG